MMEIVSDMLVSCADDIRLCAKSKYETVKNAYAVIKAGSVMVATD